MRIRPQTVLLATALLATAALGQTGGFKPQAGQKSDALDTILDDLVGGTAGSVGLTDGSHVVDGSLGQTASLMTGDLASGTTAEAGYFTEMAWTPVSTSLLLSGSGVIVSWTDAAPPNPSGTVYEVDASSTSNDFSDTVISASTSGFTTTLGGLSAATTYYLRISAGYTDDQSPYLTLGSIYVPPGTINTTPPSPITTLSAQSGPIPGSISLTWIATGLNGDSGNIVNGQYAIGASTSSTFSFSTTTAVVFFSTNTSPGATQYYNLDGLISNQLYYLTVWLANPYGSWSALGSTASAVATPTPATDITGQVLDVSTEGITGVEVDAYNTAGNLIATTFTLADGSGTYDLSGLSAGQTYKLVATWSVNGVASSVSLDGVPAGTSGFDFTLNLNYTLGALTGQLVSGSSPGGGVGGGLGVSAFRPKSTASQYIEVWSNNRRIVQFYPLPSGKWMIPNLLPGPYSVRQFDGLQYSPFVPVRLQEGQTAIVAFADNPLSADSVYAFPNPARASTTIRFQTPLQPLEAEVSIFDVAGNLVYQIPGSQIVAAGQDLYHAVWPLVNSFGQGVASGVYLAMVKIKGGLDNQTAKVITKIAVVK